MRGEHSVGHWARYSRWFALVCVLIFTPGCTRCVRSWLYSMSEQTASRQIKLFVPNLDANERIAEDSLAIEIPKGFLEDLRSRAERGPDMAARELERIELAIAVLKDPTVAKLLKAGDFVLESAGPGGAAIAADSSPVTTNSDWIELQRRLEQATITDAWTELARESREFAKRERGNTEAEAFESLAHYIKEYIKAYFTGVALIQIEVDLKKLKEDLEAKVRDRLKGLFPDLSEPDLEKKVKELLESELKTELKKLLDDNAYENINKIVDSLLNDGTFKLPVGYRLVEGDESKVAGFTSRGGENFKWPTVEVKFDPKADKMVSWSDIDAKAVGAQLLRVFLEAVADAKLKVPGVGEATAVGFEERFRLRKFKDGLDNVTASEFDQINEWSGRAEGLASSGVGQLVRGLGWISLNNEALAALIETCVGVVVRKVVESVLWKRFSKSPVNDDSDGDDVFAASAGRFVTLDFRFQSLSRPPD